MKNICTLLCAILMPFCIQAQVTELWAARYNGAGEYTDKIDAIAVDATGNVYLSGYSMNPNAYRDYLVIKMNPAGDTLWKKTFDGPGRKDDEANSITVDASGNVYSTGTSDGGGTNNDILTIKFNSAGDTLWERRYDLSGDNDVGLSVKADANGNVYVAGYSDADSSKVITNNDFTTIKYNSSGVQQWVASFNGTANDNDKMAGMTIDASANIYVCGRTFNGFDDDFVTIKYNSSGAQQWVQSVDNGGTDRAAAITISGSNVVVTGRSNDGFSDNYFTVAYNFTGTLQWQASYDGTVAGIDKATAITADATGNTYVTGQSNKDSFAIDMDYATLKYDATGAELWVSTYDGGILNDDIPSAITVDGSGNVFVTGQSDADPTAVINNNYATVKYNSSGAFVWAKTFNGSANSNDVANAVALDISGNIIVTGSGYNTATQKDGVTIKYNTSGTVIWQKIFNGAGDNSDNANAVVADASGNSYVTGYTFSSANDKDIFVAKVNSSGTIVWSQTYDGSGNKADEGNAITVDASGNVYVTGFTKTLLTAYDFITIKYNSTGVQQWAATYNGVGNGADIAKAIAVDASGNVYVTGSGVNGNLNDDFVTVKYNSTGIQVWASYYNGTGNGADKSRDIAVDGSGNVYITGRSFNGTNDDYVTLMYNSTGGQQWVSTYSGGYGNDRPSEIFIDGSASIYVTGSSSNASLNDDYATVKYNSSGVQQWASRYNGSMNSDDKAASLTVDASGNVYVTGQSVVDTAALTKNYDYLTVKYNSSGVQQWTAGYNGAANTDDIATAIAVDASGNVYITGQAENGTSTAINKDFVTVKYSSSGIQKWTATYNGTGNGADGANAITVKGAKIYVAGGSWGSASQKDIALLAYDTANVITGSQKNQDIHSLIVFSNLFSDEVILKIENALPSDVYVLDIFDLPGRMIYSYTISAVSSFMLTKKSLQEGMYCYRLVSENGKTSSGKIIVR